MVSIFSNFLIPNKLGIFRGALLIILKDYFGVPMMEKMVRGG
jgi:hypothetical protein